MSTDGQGTKCRRNIAENLNRLSRVHERYRRQADRQTTDGRATAYSEREREFTLAKNVLAWVTNDGGSGMKLLLSLLLLKMYLFK